jgi:hypothetical protein
MYQTGALPISSYCVALFWRSGDEPDRAIFPFGAPRPAMTHDVHHDEIRASVCDAFVPAPTVTTANHARAFSYCDTERHSVPLVGFPTLHR